MTVLHQHMPPSSYRLLGCWVTDGRGVPPHFPSLTRPLSEGKDLQFLHPPLTARAVPPGQSKRRPRSLLCVQDDLVRQRGGGPPRGHLARLVRILSLSGWPRPMFAKNPHCRQTQEMIRHLEHRSHCMLLACRRGGDMTLVGCIPVQDHAVLQRVGHIHQNCGAQLHHGLR